MKDYQAPLGIDLKALGLDVEAIQMRAKAIGVSDSLQKMHFVLNECETVGVITKPKRFTHRRPKTSQSERQRRHTRDDADDAEDTTDRRRSGDITSKDENGSSSVEEEEQYEEVEVLWICPILSWYHSRFDTEPNIPISVYEEAARSDSDPPLVPRMDMETGGTIPSRFKRWVQDFRRCRWPTHRLRQYDPKLLIISSNNSNNNNAHMMISNSEPTTVSGGDVSDDIALAKLVDGLNEVRNPSFNWGDKEEEGVKCSVITFSHFLPRVELMPEKRYLFFPHLAKIAGSQVLESRVRGLQPDLHIFGHTHFGWDMTLDDGIRYIQAPLSYPRERDMRLPSITVGGAPVCQCRTPSTFGTYQRNGQSDEKDYPPYHFQPLLVWSHRQRIEQSGLAPQYDGRWSSHYKNHPRDPHNLELASWVKEHCAKILSFG